MQSRDEVAVWPPLLRIGRGIAVLSLALVAGLGTASRAAPAIAGSAPASATPIAAGSTPSNASPTTASNVPANAAPTTSATAVASDYLIGPGDALEIFVWREPDLTAKVPVRPDGKISIPLVEDIDCTGKTPTELARDIEARLKKFINDPVVTVIVDNLGGASAQQVKVVGEAVQPKSLPYRAHMTVLDAMIDVGGLTAYAAGNRASIIRTINGKETSTRVHLGDLLKDGDMNANVELQPGDIIIIPQTFF